MAIWTLARKDLRLLLRDRRALIILVAMPFIFILILGLSLGEGFGEKPDDRLRVSLVDLDQGNLFSQVREGMAHLLMTPQPEVMAGGVEANRLAGLTLAAANRGDRPPPESWARVVQRDLEETAGIRLEIVPSRQEAERLVRNGSRSAVLIFEPTFSEKVTRSSFLAEGLNPFYRDGVKLSELDLTLLRDETQLAAASIIEQVAQVTLLRVVLPWMIGRAFDKLSEPQFIEMLGNRVRLPVPKGAEFLFRLKGIQTSDGKASLNDALRVAAPDDKALREYRDKVGEGVQDSLGKLFEKYELRGKNWAALTRSEPKTGGGAGVTRYADDGSGLLRRGAVRYQVLVPSYTVMFAFFLVLTVGWLFVSERRQGTLKRLRAAPLTRTQILLGKLVPCYALSLAQGLFLLSAGRLVFGMSWGPQPWWLLAVIATTSLAAMGMALLVASLARTETQVAIYGTLLVLVLAGVSGCLMPRELMPEQMKQISRVTPHAWALDAYTQLLLSPTPNLAVVGLACAVLTGFGIGFVLLAWWSLNLE